MESTMNPTRTILALLAGVLAFPVAAGAQDARSDLAIEDHMICYPAADRFKFAFEFTGQVGGVVAVRIAEYGHRVEQQLIPDKQCRGVSTAQF